ncbi:mucin-19-like [Oryzias latipes]|uniref:mucin-19-like n=1 Tax=Oryzias latipes TaxID=8090 RepID=UPI000CE180CB|nr:mucin-19-like [Oryzias latipes]
MLIHTDVWKFSQRSGAARLIFPAKKIFEILATMGRALILLISTVIMFVSWGVKAETSPGLLNPTVGTSSASEATGTTNGATGTTNGATGTTNGATGTTNGATGTTNTMSSTSITTTHNDSAATTGVPNKSSATLLSPMPHHAAPILLCVVAGAILGTA